MFWYAVRDGFMVLTYWETYVGILLYVAIIIPLIGFGIAMEKNEAIGCLGSILTPIVQTFGAMIFIFTLFPIILGIANDASWSLPWVLLINNPMFFLKIIGILLLASIILAFIPVIGQIESLYTLTLGAICLASMLGLINSLFPGLGIEQIDPLPDLTYLIGFLVIAGLASWLGRMAVAFLAVAVEDRLSESLAEWVMLPLGSVFGFIPVFIYGAWLGNQLWLL